jgi:hypothetical protein
MDVMMMMLALRSALMHDARDDKAAITDCPPEALGLSRDSMGIA